MLIFVNKHANIWTELQKIIFWVLKKPRNTKDEWRFFKGEGFEEEGGKLEHTKKTFVQVHTRTAYVQYDLTLQLAGLNWLVYCCIRLGARRQAAASL